MKTFFLKTNKEIFFWISGILFLLFIQPSADGHFSLCILKSLGIDFCPGCGLGKSISYLLHLNFSESFNSHPLGIPAFIIIMHRIISLLRDNVMLFNFSRNKNGSIRRSGFFREGVNNG